MTPKDAEKTLFVNLPLELHAQVKAKAAIEGTSIKEVVIKLLRGWVEERAGE